MKIIMVDNFNRENISDKLIVEKVDKWWGETIVSLLNDHHHYRPNNPNNPNFFRLVKDDYKLYEFKP
jgi:hypothetical protein